MALTLIFRGLLVLYGLYVLLVEVVGDGRLVRNALTKILFTLFILVWFIWLFVYIEVPYGWGHDAVAGPLGAVQPGWLRSTLRIIWAGMAVGQVVVPHLVYRSRRAGDGLVAAVLAFLLLWIVSPLNSLLRLFL